MKETQRMIQLDLARGERRQLDSIAHSFERIANALTAIAGVERARLKLQTDALAKEGSDGRPQDRRPPESDGPPSGSEAG